MIAARAYAAHIIRLHATGLWPSSGRIVCTAVQDDAALALVALAEFRLPGTVTPEALQLSAHRSYGA